MNYNTVREHLKMPEYGRHIQKLVDHARSLEDKTDRQDVVEQIILMMGYLNPSLKSVNDFEQKLWDHIFTIADFDLDVESPFEIPTAEKVNAKPAPFPYPHGKIKYRHYGKNLEAMIAKAVAIEDEEKRAAFTKLIATFMKRTYANYNKDGVNDEIIKGDLAKFSNGVLTIDDDQQIRVKNMGGGRKRNNNNRRRNNGGNNRNRNNNNNRKRHRR